MRTKYYFLIGIINLMQCGMVNEQVVIKGKEVEYIFFPNEAQFVSHGEFTIKNNTTAVAEVSVDRCIFLSGDLASEVRPFFIFEETTSESIENPIVLRGKESKAIRITFPAQEVNRHTAYKVDVDFKVGEIRHTSSSAIRIIMETK